MENEVTIIQVRNLLRKHIYPYTNRVSIRFPSFDFDTDHFTIEVRKDVYIWESKYISMIAPIHEIEYLIEKIREEVKIL